MHPEKRNPEQNEISSNYEIEEQKKDIVFLAELTMSGLELADLVQSSRHEVVAKEATISISPRLVDDLPVDVIPTGLESMISRQDLEISIEFSWQYLSERPLLRLFLYDESRGDSPVIVMEQKSSPGSVTSDFQGYFIDIDGIEHNIRLNQDELAVLIEEFTSAKNIVINEEGAINTRLMKELVSDPQYPPTARFIQDTLIEKGCTYTIKDRYEIDIDDKTYPVEVTTENGKITSLEITDTFYDEFVIEHDQPSQHVRGILTQISAHDLSVSVQFNKMENGMLTPYSGDHGDRLRLIETINYMKDNL